MTETASAVFPLSETAGAVLENAAGLPAKIILLSRRNVLAAIAHSACDVLPMVPFELEKALNEAHDLLSTRPYTYSVGFWEMPDTQLPDFIESIIEGCPSIRDWNLSAKEREAGVKVDDPDRAAFTFTSAFSEPLPIEHEFIDLDALRQNITRLLELLYLR